MATLIYCPTDTAVLVVGLRREDGLLLFPTDAGDVPGIVRKINTSLPINPQLIDMAVERTGMPRIEISVWQEFECTIVLPDGEPATVYAARVIQTAHVIPDDVKTLPDILRGMPQNRNRVAYMKAMQVFSGALTESTKAVDLDEVHRHFKSLTEKSRNRD